MKPITRERIEKAQQRADRLLNKYRNKYAWVLPRIWKYGVDNLRNGTVNMDSLELHRTQLEMSVDGKVL